MDVSGDNLVSRVREETYLQDRIAALLLAIFSGLTLFGLTAAWPTDTHDAVIHFQRTEALAGALRAGVIYPRWFPDRMFGFGVPDLNYYSPGFYYPAALLHLAGLDLVSSMRVTLSFGFAISAWWMFRLARLYVSLWPAMVSVICFQFFPYRIYDLFIRGAFPEFSAFFWLPLIALCTIQAATAGKKAWGASSYPMSLAKAGLAWAGLIVTHNLTMLMALLLFGAALTLYTVFQQRARASFLCILGSSLAPVVLGIILTAWYILPALLELRWVLAGHGLSSGLSLPHLLSLRELIDFGIFYTYIIPTLRPKLPIYIIPTALAALVAVSTMRSRNLRLFTLVSLALTLGVVWMMTEASAWLWIRGELLLEYIQFPWRWQVFAALGVALLLAASLESLRRSARALATVVPLLSILISVYLFACASVRLDYESNEDIPYQIDWPLSMVDWLWYASNSISYRDFLPIWTAETMEAATEAGQRPWEHPPNMNPFGSAVVAPTGAGLLQQRYLVTAEQTFRLLFHQFYFPPWRVTVDGIQVEVQPATAFSLASVVIPPGTHTVEFAWRATTAVWLGRIVTAVGWLVVLILMSHAARATDLFCRAQKAGLRGVWQVRSPLVWLAVGAFMIVAASGVTARTWDVAAIGADYGHIRLEGVRSIPPVRAGEVAPVHLTWLVTGPGSPVSAFVHLVDEAGMGLSQHDGPPGGVYTPFQRWTPGLILNSTHMITTPDSLSPGRYRLIAGLYYPDLSHEPLVPLNGDYSRLEIGTLEVVP